LFLREDIYEVLRKYDEDLDKKDSCIINWSKNDLVEFIGRRIEAGFDLQPSYLKGSEWKEMWNHVFPTAVDKKPVTDFIIERSLMRPRDVLIFCKKALERAQDNNHASIDVEDVLDSESDYSLDRLVNIGTEYLINYPGLTDFLFDTFNNTMTILREDGLANQIAQYIQKESSNKSWDEIHEWLEPACADNSILKILYDIGFIGIKQKDNSITYSYDKTYSYAESSSLLEETHMSSKKRVAIFFSKEVTEIKKYKIFVIHPAFRKVLQCT
jgi:hypothetical protein